MAHCSNCNKELKEGEAFGLVRIQLWKTKVGSKECKQPDMDDTRPYCSPCVEKAQIHISRE